MHLNNDISISQNIYNNLNDDIGFFFYKENNHNKNVGEEMWLLRVFLKKNAEKDDTSYLFLSSLVSIILSFQVN